MNVLTLVGKFSAILIICALGAMTSDAFAQGKEKAKAKDSTKIETHENHGREAGDLPYGLHQYSEQKAKLPSGVQKKKDEGSLSRGLAEGGRRTTALGKAKKGK